MISIGVSTVPGTLYPQTQQLKKKKKYVRHMTNFIGANKEDSGHRFLIQKKKHDYNSWGDL